MISEEMDFWQLGKTLKRLSDLKKTLRYDLAAGLARLHEAGDWDRLGYRSFEEYCTTRLGFGVRRGEQLIRFHAGLAKFPLLKTSYLHERMSYTAALALLPILHPATEEAWIAWIDGDQHVPSHWKPGPNRITYRQIERVTDYARMYALPGASPSVLASWVKGLAKEGRVVDPEKAHAFSVESCAETLDSAAATVPTGYSLPPARDRDLPTISGVPPDLVFTAPEREVAQIRFWLPKDALVLAQRALDHARRTSEDPHRPTWFYFEKILTHFIRTINNPVARAANRRHPIIMRDGFWCIVPGCMCRGNLDSDHFKPRGECGPDDPFNLGGECHWDHDLGCHKGRIVRGGWAPDYVIWKLGIHPKTGRAFTCYINEREVSEEVADRELAKWRTWLREWAAARLRGIELPRPDYVRQFERRENVGCGAR